MTNPRIREDNNLTASATRARFSFPAVQAVVEQELRNAHTRALPLEVSLETVQMPQATRLKQAA